MACSDEGIGHAGQIAKGLGYWDDTGSRAGHDDRRIRHDGGRIEGDGAVNPGAFDVAGHHECAGEVVRYDAEKPPMAYLRR